MNLIYEFLWIVFDINLPHIHQFVNSLDLLKTLVSLIFSNLLFFKRSQPEMSLKAKICKIPRKTAVVGVTFSIKMLHTEGLQVFFEKVVRCRQVGCTSDFTFTEPYRNLTRELI